MNDELNSRIELFSANNMKAREDFVWQNVMIKRLSALLYTAENKEIDCDAIRECYALIKQNTSLFSVFRGNLALSVAAMLSLTKNRGTQLSDTLAVYDMMRENGFRASDYLAVAAYQIAADASSDKYSLTIERAKAFYDGMRSRHFFLTGQDDYIFAAMLGLSDVGVDSGVARMDELYAALKPELSSANGVQAITQVLVLGGQATEAVSRILSLRAAFIERKLSLDKTYTLSSLGVLSLLPADVSTIVSDVDETYEAMRSHKGLGQWSITKQELLLLSAALVSFQYMDDMKNGILNATLTTSITNIIIAQQTAIALAAASSAAAASSTSS